MKRTFFTSDPNTTVQRIKLVAQLLVNGDLPIPPKNKITKIKSWEDALKIIFSHKNLTELCAKSEPYIHMVALSTQLSDGSLWSALKYKKNGVAHNKSEIQIIQDVQNLLASVSDSKWEQVRHLAEKAGFKLSAPESPDREQMTCEAMERLKKKRQLAS